MGYQNWGPISVSDFEFGMEKPETTKVAVQYHRNTDSLTILIDDKAVLSLPQNAAEALGQLMFEFWVSHRSVSVGESQFEWATPIGWSEED